MQQGAIRAMSSSLHARALDLVGSALDHRRIPLGINRWPALARYLHATPAQLLETYWPLRSSDRYLLHLDGVRRIAESDSGLWLIRHGLLQIGSGPDGTLVVVSNDDSLQVNYVCMQESLHLMNEGSAEPPPKVICDLTLDVFELLRQLEWMAEQYVDGRFPDHLQIPIPLDYYDAVEWRKAGRSTRRGPSDGDDRSAASDCS